MGMHSRIVIRKNSRIDVSNFIHVVLSMFRTHYPTNRYITMVTELMEYSQLTRRESMESGACTSFFT